MANFLNDGSLIGFWPLNEPSGAPVFLNYSPARSRQPSGISFDFHVAQAENQNANQVKSLWPGTTTLFNPESGVNYQGFMVQGYWKLGTDSSPYSRYLVMGNGCSQSREQTLSQNVAQSGITAGIWVYPNSNGYLNFITDSNLVSFALETEGTRCHMLFGQKQFNSLGGWQIGISGAMDQGAQFNSVASNRQLTAFASIERAGGSPTVLRVPIESGCFTHLTFTFRYINGTADEVVLYKNGRFAASGISNTGAGGASSTSLANVTLQGRALTIGGGDNANAGTNNYGGTCGWNHLVSGAYIFRRVLNEGEILDLHQGQTLQPLQDNIKQPIKVEFSDSALLAHYPFRSVGWGDTTKYHRPLIGPKDEGPSAHYIPIPGPFGNGGMLLNGTNASDHIVAQSGLAYDMINARSWTICMIAGPTNNNARDDNMLFSMGSISAAIAGAPTAITTSTFGMAMTEITTPNRIRFSAYPLGDLTASVFNMETATSGYYNGVSHLYAVAYDDGTKGLAVYVDGHLQGSGTLAHSLTDQLLRLAGSGYPLMFFNGVADAIVDSTSHGVLAAGGQDVMVGPIAIFGRALLPEELMYIAQSGIDTTSVWRTLYDPRLVGYWPCSDFKLDDVVVEDRARAWDTFPGNLVRGDTTTKWTSYYTLGERTNQFGTRTTPPELASYGVLGITSGIFGVHGVSPGVGTVTDAAAARSSIANFCLRYKPVNEINTGSPQNIIGEFIIGFEVTPSGNIPATSLGLTSDSNKFEHNSTLSVYGNLADGGTGGELRSFLTTINAPQGSGVSIVFASRTGTFSAANYTSLVSGVLPFGVPSKVMLHTKFDAPYNNNDAAGTAQLTVTLWISGVPVHRRTMTSQTARIWTDGAPDSTIDDFLLQFGGEAGNDTITTQVSRDSGLGEIYMREIFVMHGIFDKDEVAALAASGIQAPTIAGYTPTQTKTQVTIADSALEGYWRFNGLDGGGSGTRDLSLAFNHLDPLSEKKNRAGTSTIASRSFKFLPGPLQDSDIGVRCSGLSYQDATASTTNITPPFAVSGVEFDSPQNGFSIGFLMSKRATITGSTIESLLTYGIASANSVSSTTIDFNRGWMIYTDDNNDIKMCVSVGGNGLYDNASAAAQSGQLVCGTFDADSIYEDLTRFNNYRFGTPKPPRFDFWSHYCWVYDPTEKELKCYVNGVEVDRKATKVAVDPLNGGPPSGLNPIVPVNPAARMITFFSPALAAPWDWGASNLNDERSVLTDIFYFSRALTEAEVRYVAMNGIDNAVGTPTSGVIGGFIHGQDTGSGHIGGYTRGQDTASGCIGGFIPGSIVASGLCGGYVSGIIFGTGTIGGFVQGMDFASGVMAGYILGAVIGSGMIAGYIRGQDVGSGLFGGIILGSNAASGAIGGFLLSAGTMSGIAGGYILGGLQGRLEFDTSFTVEVLAAEDFDAQLEIAKTTSSDFDAKLIIFQNELPPLVEIIIPSASVSGLMPPFNQYFIGAASGQQGKTITQTRWNFGDFSPTVSVAESGAGLYPVQHYFAASGFYIVRFEAIDSDGLHASATRIVNAASGIDPVVHSLSGVPRSGTANLTVDFTTTVDVLPPGVSIVARLLAFDDGQTTTAFNPTHVYTEPGTYKPIWCVRDSRGVTWCDSLEAGNDFLTSGGA